MMGKSHAISGAAVWIAATAPAPLGLELYPLSATGILIGSLVTAGAALLPDIDHHNGTIAHSGGIVTRAIAALAGAVSGGHRHGLHTALAAAVFTAVTVLAARSSVEVPHLGAVPVGSALILLALVAFAARALELSRGGRIKLWFTALVVTLFVLAYAPAELSWLPVAVMIGFLTHLLGDFVTTGGLPLLWPLPIKPPRAIRRMPILGQVWLPNGYVAFPILGNAGSAREWVLTGAMSLYVGVGLFLTGGVLLGLVDRAGG